MSRVFSLRWLILLPSMVLLLVPVLGYFWLVSAVTELEEYETLQLQNAADTAGWLQWWSVASPTPDYACPCNACASTRGRSPVR